MSEIPPTQFQNLQRYGDIILWFQLLDYARYQKKPIIFITDDGKKDWWIRDSQGKPIRPLPELIQEMFVEASVLLHMYQGYEFLKAAVHFLKLEEKPEIIEEAKDVSEQNAMETNLARRRMIPEKSIESRAYFAVLEWLESLFPESKLIQQPGSAFLIEELNGKVIDVVVNFSFDPIFPQKIRESIFRYFRGMRGMPTDKQMLVLVFSSSELADRVAENALKDLTTIPTNISLVVGYLTDDIRFINISVIGCPLTTSDKDQGDKLQ
jgi:PIN like domain